MLTLGLIGIFLSNRCSTSTDMCLLKLLLVSVLVDLPTLQKNTQKPLQDVGVGDPKIKEIKII